MKTKFSKLWWVVVTALVLVSVLAAQSVEPPAINAPNHAEVQSGSAKNQPISNKPQQEQQVHALNGDAVAAADVETQRLLNELRRELLDSQQKKVDWWLAATAIFLTLLGVGAAILGYFGFKTLDKIEGKAHKSMEAAENFKNQVDNFKNQSEKHLKAIERNREKSDLMTTCVNLTPAGDDDENGNDDENSEELKKVLENAKYIQKDQNSDDIEKAIAAAFLLQQKDKIDEAIIIWTSIANILERNDNRERAAMAWFYVGSLHKKKEKFENSMKAYDKSIRLNPNSSNAYNSRGNLKASLQQYESSIDDYDEAIVIESGNPVYYNNRGASKSNLGQYESAIDDYDNAIKHKSNYAKAYFNRGKSKAQLNRTDEAREDIEEALKLSQDTGITDVVTAAKSLLEKLDKGEIP